MTLFKAIYGLPFDPSFPWSVRIAAAGFSLISIACFIGGPAVMLNGIYHTFFKKRG